MDGLHALPKLQALEGQDLAEIASEFGVTIRKVGGNGSKSNLNKGWAGLAVERYLGIPQNSSRSPNLGSWELKVVPMKLSNGSTVPKESMAITQLDPCEVLFKDFRDSHLYTKINRLIIVSRLVEPETDSSIVLGCSTFRLEDSPLRKKIEQDYQDIRQAIRDGKNLSGKMGKCIQPRTKGKGHGSTSRAFYARRKLVAHMAEFDSMAYQRAASGRMCGNHSGQQNDDLRKRLDEMVANLPENQSGKGRHKCVYCAYEAGFRDGLDSVRHMRS